MKKFIARVVAVSMALTMAAAALAAPVSAEWVKTSGGSWRYTQSNGSYIRSRFEKIDGKWYMFNNVGNMVTGWYNLPGTQNWYYLRGDGSAVINNWVSDRGDWYYIGANGIMITGWRQVGGTWYYFQPDGRMTRHWAKITVSGETDWYWFDQNGAMFKNSWLKYQDKWYWLDEKGRMAHDCALTIGGVQYFFDADGVMLDAPVTASASTVYDAVSKAVTDRHAGADSAVANPYEISLGEMGDAYGLDTSAIKTFRGAQAMMMTNCDMLLVAEARPGKAKAVKAAFEEILKSRIEQFEWYSVMGNTERCAAAKVVAEGDYVALIMVGVYDNDTYDCKGDVAAAVKAFNKEV